VSEEAPITLLTPLSRIEEISPRDRAALATLELTSVGKLAAYLPLRHEKHEAEANIDQLVPEAIGSARGEVVATRLAGAFRSQRFEAVLMDGTGRLDLVWFNAPYLRDKIRPGMRIRVQGKARKRGVAIQIANPKYETIRDDEPERRDAKIRAVYPASESCPSTTIEKVLRVVLPLALPLIEDHLPEEFRRERALPTLRDAYRMIHQPESDNEPGEAIRRLAYDELLLLQLGVHMKRAMLRRFQRSPALKFSDTIDRHIRERLPFTLTPSQDAVITDLIKDLTSEVPTNRLIQGDVGSGKTAVAAYAMLLGVASQRQAALLAPTEVLAEQHHRSLSELLKGSQVRVELLTGSTPEELRSSILARLASGDIDIIVGTHAILTESVRFKSLGIAIIDEQHRFGVAQRAVLREKGAEGTPDPADPRPVVPHIIVMTATPIPRTMAITLFGDLDISSIRGMPPGRKPVKTTVVPRSERQRVYDDVRACVQRGEQAFVVVPAIDGSGGEDDGPPEAEAGTGGANLRDVLAELEGSLLQGLRIAGLHGRLKTSTRERLMHRFRLKQIDVLVATTVIEVGVDIPNATAMIVEDADRFGLAQLHQLRGRVGRGEKPGVCVLIADTGTEKAAERLGVMEKSNDGFVLAEKDFEIRGPGELFGTRQSGLPPFRVADLSRDRALLAMARRDASAWIERSPDLAAAGEELLKKRLLRAHGTTLGLGDVG
jgi:ATP-dependent DNA helicase RecG